MTDPVTAPASGWDMKHVAGIVGMGAAAVVFAPIVVPAVLGVGAASAAALGLGAMATGLGGVAGALGLGTFTAGAYAALGGVVGHFMFKPKAA